MIIKDDFLKDHIKYIYSDSLSFYLSVKGLIIILN